MENNIFLALGGLHHLEQIQIIIQGGGERKKKEK